MAPRCLLLFRAFVSILVLAQALAARAEDAAGDKVEVTVELRGVLGENERLNIQNFLGFEQAEQDGTLTLARAKTLIEAAPKSAAQALEPFGYYQAKITTQLRGAPPKLVAYVEVDLGEPVRWIEPELVIEGDVENAALFKAVLADSRIRPGRRLLHSDYEALKTALVSAARNSGYLDASLVRNVLRVDPAQATAQALFTLMSGRRFYFGETRFEGNTAVRETLLRRYLSYEQGQPFNPQALINSQFLLSDTEYFEKVELNAQREATEGDRVPVLVSLKPRKNRRDSVGLGYGTDTGFRGSIGSDVRRLNRQGHKLTSELRISEKLSSVNALWRVPQGDLPSEFLSFSAAVRQEKFSDEVGTEDYKLGVSLNRTLGSYTRRYYLEFTRSITDIGYSQAARDAGLRLDGETTVLVPGISLSTSRINDPINVTKGFSVFGDLHGAQQGLLSSTSFLQARTVVQGVYPLPYRLRLSGRGELGATVVKGLSALPLEQRFFAGGDDSVRGYGYRSLGVRDADGHNLGGRFLNAFSVELERAVRGPYGAAVFWDFGGADDTPTPTLHHGAGVGLRYRAPFGAVRIDLAHPFDEDTSPVRLHLGVRVGL